MENLKQELIQKGAVNHNGLIIRTNWATSFDNSFKPHYEYWVEQDYPKQKMYLSLEELLKDKAV